MTQCIVAIDQGSSSTKVLAIDHEGRPVFAASRSLPIDRPLPDHVEQDAVVLLRESLSALDEVLEAVHAHGGQAAAIGLACQRSSFLLWNRETGSPLTPVITWQDLRAKELCRRFVDEKGAIYQKTGLPLTGHYGGPKFLWLLENDPAASRFSAQPPAAFTPLSSFLLWHLTAERIFALDEAIAGRTLFFNIHKRAWDRELLELFQIPDQILPQIRPTCHPYGHYRFRNRAIPITCSVGDHQGALIGLGGFQKGQCAINYGTSAGVLVNIGTAPIVVEGLLTNIAYSTGEKRLYKAEGTVNAVGSLFAWFEKERGIPGAALHWEENAAPSAGGWHMLPGMYGIAAPYWKETAPTRFAGPGNFPAPEVLLRAGMESIAFLICDIMERFETVSGFAIDRIVAAGGAARLPLLQFQSDLLGKKIFHSSVSDATALGCGFLAGLQSGFWEDPSAIAERIDIRQEIRPGPLDRQARVEDWHRFLKSMGVRE